MDIRITSGSTIGTPVPPPTGAVLGREAVFEAIVKDGDAKKNFVDGTGSASAATVELPDDAACDEQALIQEDERLSAAEQLFCVPVEDCSAESHETGVEHGQEFDQEFDQVATDLMPDASDARDQLGQSAPFAGQQATKDAPAEALIISPTMHRTNVLVQPDSDSIPSQESATLDDDHSNSGLLPAPSEATTTSVIAGALALGHEDDGAPALVASQFRPKSHKDVGTASPKTDRNSVEFTQHPQVSKRLSAMSAQGIAPEQAFAQDVPPSLPNESQVRQTPLVATGGEPSRQRTKISASGSLATGNILGSSLAFDTPDQTLPRSMEASTEQLPLAPDRTRAVDATTLPARLESNQTYAFGILNTPETAKISQPTRDWRTHLKTPSVVPAESVGVDTRQVLLVEDTNLRLQPVTQIPTTTGDQPDPYSIGKLTTSDLVIENLSVTEQNATIGDQNTSSLYASARLNPEPVLLSNTPQNNAVIPPQQQLAAEIIRNIKSTGETELVLTPEELGPVRFAISHEDGAVTISITAERADTLMLLRRHSEMLSAELAQAGLAGASIDFGGSGRERDGTRAPMIERAAQEAAENLPDDPPASRTKRRTGAAGRLDLRL